MHYSQTELLQSCHINKLFGVLGARPHLQPGWHFLSDFSSAFVPPTPKPSTATAAGFGPPEDAIAMVTALGFTRPQAIKALKATVSAASFPPSTLPPLAPSFYLPSLSILLSPSLPLPSPLPPNFHPPPPLTRIIMWKGQLIGYSAMLLNWTRSLWTLTRNPRPQLTLMAQEVSTFTCARKHTHARTHTCTHNQ